jgi:hypothetical protein
MRISRRDFVKSATASGIALSITPLAIAALLGGAMAWSHEARAQQSAKPVVGFLNVDSPQGYAKQLSAFLKGLGENGYVDGHNVAIEYRWAENRIDRCRRWRLIWFIGR